MLNALCEEDIPNVDSEIAEQIMTDIKYEGYLNREMKRS